MLVGCCEEDVHRVNLADDNWLYFIGLDASGTPQGFAVLRNRHDADGSEFLRRIVVANAGRGFGKPFLSALIGRHGRRTREKSTASRAGVGRAFRTSSQTPCLRESVT